MEQLMRGNRMKLDFRFMQNWFKPKVAEPMKTVFLFRRWASGTEIMSSLHFEGNTLYTMELPWKNNKSNISCIPSGEYICKFLKRSASGKYRNVWHVPNVIGRSGILLHNGNLVIHTKGCPLIGKKIGVLGGRKAVLGSRSGLRQFNRTMGTEDFKLIIIGDQHV